MLKNYLKIAYRNLLIKKGFSIINITGLSIGMTCCLLIFQYVAFEYSFDKFHLQKDNLYRILQGYSEKGGPFDMGGAYTAQSLAPALKEDVPEILNITRVHAEEATISPQNFPEKVFDDDAILYVDSAFIKMFSFPIISGNPQGALAPGTVLISSTVAKKYFGDIQAEGQILDITGMVSKPYTISGVFEDPPSNSHLQFDVLLPMEDLLQSENYVNEPEGGWSWNNFTTYVQLQENADQQAVNQKMTATFQKHHGEALRQQGWTASLALQPITDIHLNADISAPGNVVMGSYRTVYFFLVIGIITLVIALVNYINLATARAVSRSREVGVRKVVGAKRIQLVIQFLCESALTNLAAASLALVFASLLIPVVNEVAETKLSIDLWMNPGFWAAFSLVLLTGTLLAGLYPAFVLSSFKPATVLKGRTVYLASHLWLRKSLVVIQFSASIVLLAGTAIVYNQLDYMKRMDLGLNLEQVLTVRSPRVFAENADQPTAMQTFVQEVKSIPGVEQAALSSSIPGSGFNWNGAAIRKSTDDPSEAIRGVATYIDSAFAGLYGMELVAGKAFAGITFSDADDAPWMIMLNETAARSLGYATAQDAVGQSINVGGYNAEVVGVYKDFKWSSAHHEQQNIVFGFTQAGQHVSIRISAPAMSDVVKKVEDAFNTLFPGNVFHYAFADESFNQQYQNEQHFAKLFSVSAGMTIFIACLGLFGLVAFTAQQRTKEIGMRKVLGATVTGIVSLLGKDFLKLVIVGFVFAVPMTWYIMNQWLENFAYRIQPGVGIFLLAGGAAMLIAMITVSWQAFKAAVANPVNSLRSE